MNPKQQFCECEGRPVLILDRATSIVTCNNCNLPIKPKEDCGDLALDRNSPLPLVAAPKEERACCEKCEIKSWNNGGDQLDCRNKGECVCHVTCPNADAIGHNTCSLCNPTDADLDAAFEIAAHAPPKEPRVESWEGELTKLVEAYATAAYLVDEESHPVEKVKTAMLNVLNCVGNTLSSERARLRKAIEGTEMGVNSDVYVANVKKAQQSGAIYDRAFDDGFAHAKERILNDLLEDLKD